MDEYCEVELPNGVIVKAKLGTGMPPTNLGKSKSEGLVPIEKGDTQMLSTDLEKKVEAFFQKAKQDAEQALARVEAKIQASRPAPLPSRPQLSGLSFPELQAMTRAGTLSLNDFNSEMDLRRKSPKVHQVVKESVAFANDQVTAARLGALVKEKYMTERTQEKKEAILKSAIDESIARWEDAELELHDSNLSTSERRQVEAAQTRESEFQEELLGGAEAVAKYWQAYLNRPQPTMEAVAKADLVELAKGGDEVATELQAYFAEQQSIKRAKANEKRTYNIAVRAG